MRYDDRKADLTLVRPLPWLKRSYSDKAIAMAKWPNILLTTLQNPIEPLVAGTIELLLARQVDPERPGETKWLDAGLVLRATH